MASSDIEIIATCDKYSGTIFKKPCNIVIFAPVFSGKTFFCQRLLQHKHVYFDDPPDNIVFFIKNIKKSMMN